MPGQAGATVCPRALATTRRKDTSQSQKKLQPLQPLPVVSPWGQTWPCILSFLPTPVRAKGTWQPPRRASSPTSRGRERALAQAQPAAASGGKPASPIVPTCGLSSDAELGLQNREHPRGRIPAINVAARYCETPNSPICVLPPKRENSLHRHSLIWQANSKPHWQPRACFPKRTALEPKIVLPAMCWGGNQPTAQPVGGPTAEVPALPGAWRARQARLLTEATRHHAFC